MGNVLFIKAPIPFQSVHRILSLPLPSTASHSWLMSGNEAYDMHVYWIRILFFSWFVIPDPDQF